MNAGPGIIVVVVVEYSTLGYSICSAGHYLAERQSSLDGPLSQSEHDLALQVYWLIPSMWTPSIHMYEWASAPGY